MRFVASGSGSELMLFDLRLLKPEEASSVKSNRGLLVLEALLPLPNFEWKTEDGRGHVTAFLSTQQWLPLQLGRLSTTFTSSCEMYASYTFYLKDLVKEKDMFSSLISFIACLQNRLF